jgi:hypothetical protein
MYLNLLFNQNKLKMIKSYVDGKKRHGFFKCKKKKKNSPSVLKYLLQYETVFKKKEVEEIGIF